MDPGQPLANPNIALVLAPDVVLRAAGGRLHVHTGTGAREFATGNAAVIAMLMGFVQPRTPEAALEALSPAAAAEARDALAKCIAMRALVPWEGAGEASRSPPAMPQLTMLADAVQGLAGTVEAMGAEGARLLQQSTGIDPGRRISALMSGVLALNAALQEVRPAFVADQLLRLGVDASTRGLRLNLGSGPRRLPGWINVDAGDAQLSLDLRWGLPFADGACSHVFMSHVLEHFYYPDEALGVLREIRRVLAPGGRVRLIVPDVQRCIEAYVAEDEAFFRDREKTWNWWTASTRLEGFLAYAGAGPRAGHFLESHKFGYDYETLAITLRRSGFTSVERSTFQGSTDAVLLVDDSSLVAGAKSGDASYSLFVEAS